MGNTLAAFTVVSKPASAAPTETLPGWTTDGLRAEIIPKFYCDALLAWGGFEFSYVGIAAWQVRKRH